MKKGEIVRFTRDLNEYMIKEGDRGTIAEVVPEGYVIKFVSDAYVTVEASVVEPMPVVSLKANDVTLDMNKKPHLLSMGNK